ncbi:RNA polymerase subunit sigma-70 [Aestuariivirga litoralis]|uniref:RNA polymerase subunit sigma-70 n=1 Tax=Aestuariivirga litoralis TaxID=2650924 RepID=UPI0018C4A325|nr:RNA polymerase subunit sigma-70 [Aestuariivirga litoralis]MBG1231153.1 sigma-70 family RNA polymerase sigma factor [Aestuariivirga litoralis]
MDKPAAPPASATFSALADAMRGELKRHCYRMMGGVQDAEDCVQEALLRGWRELASLRDEAMARPWLYSIATRVCLDALRKRKRRQALFGPSLDEIEPGLEPWIEPFPGGVPSEGPERGQNLRLAFVSMLHGLSARARAALLLHDLVGMTAAEVGTALSISTDAARSALQRARAALPLQDASPTDDVAVESYIKAWNAGDVNALIGLLHQDIVMTMPPWQRTFRGRDEVARFMTGVWPRYEAFRTIALVANGQPTVALYAKRDGGKFLPHSLHVLGGRGPVSEIVLYAPPLGAQLMATFGLPPVYE